jgi:septal ring factor EnvC (AmiA/AmiB activator)
VQRAYRARLAAAGKVVRIVDASSAPLPPAITDYDPTIDGIYERAMIESMRDQLQNALSKLERWEQDVARLQQRNAYLEGELKLQEQYLTNALKDNILLKQQLAQKPAKRRQRLSPASAR